MSAVLVLDNRVVCAWNGEIPKEGDVVWLESTDKLFVVVTVVHVMGLEIANRMGGLHVAYPTSMRRIFVEDMDNEGGAKELRSQLKDLKAQGV